MRVAGILFLLLLGLGCDTPDRVSRLEKQSTEFKTELEKFKASSGYELQEKCSRDGKEWLRDNWRNSKDTIFMSYNMHYNKGSNICFMTIEHHVKSMFGEDGSWSNVMEVWDVLENSKYAAIQVDHLVRSKPQFHVGDEVAECEVAGNKCKSFDEFNTMTRPYMSN